MCLHCNCIFFFISPDISSTMTMGFHMPPVISVGQPQEKRWLWTTTVNFYSRYRLWVRPGRKHCLQKLAVIVQILLLCFISKAVWEGSSFLSCPLIKANFCYPIFGDDAGNQSTHSGWHLLPHREGTMSTQVDCRITLAWYWGVGRVTIQKKKKFEKQWSKNSRESQSKLQQAFNKLTR